MSKTIFAADHDATTRIGVTNEPREGKASLVVSVYRTGASRPQRIRYANPLGVTTWFENNSRNLTRAWQAKYHASGLTGADFEKGEHEHDTMAEVPPRLVPYHSQRDNEVVPSGTCNVTSYAMVMGFYNLPPLLKKKAQLEDNLALWMKAEGLERTDHNDLVRMARAHGLDTSFQTGVSLDEMRGHLAKGYLLVVSGKFTASGHIVCVYGVRDSGFRVHDPWGIYPGYRDHNGKALYYSAKTMQDVCINRRPGSGAWVHVIKGVLR